MSVLGAGHVCKQSVQYNAAANCTTRRPSGKTKTTLLFLKLPHNTTQLLFLYITHWPFQIAILNPTTTATFSSLGLTLLSLTLLLLTLVPFKYEPRRQTHHGPGSTIWTPLLRSLQLLQHCPRGNFIFKHYYK